MAELAEEHPYQAFIPGEAFGALEGVFLLKRTGVPLATWTRNPLPQDVVSVMAATMLSSVETISSAIGAPRPKSIVVETDRHRILASGVSGNTLLVLIAPLSMQASTLRRQARRIAARVARVDPSVSASRAVASVGARSSEDSEDASGA